MKLDPNPPMACLALVAMLSASAGCARDAGPIATPALIDPRQEDAAATIDSLIDDLLQARIVYVGEQHDRAEHHEVQLRILEALHDADPSLAIGMEMFERTFQGALDDWVAGRIDAHELRAQTEYDERWGYDFELYRPILEHARTHGIRVVALNARRETTRAVAQGGLESLDEAERAALPELDLESPAHRNLVRSALTAHGDMEEEQLERFYVAQVIWDETMAEAIAETLAEEGAPARMIVLAGRMHVQNGLGIPDRAARRGADPYRIVLPIASNDRATLTAVDDRPAADWLWLL